MIPTPLIAIVDDDGHVREAMGQLVRSFDFSVELYGSACELLSSASINNVDCVITDIEMPNMNGFVMCDRLRALGLQMPVIFMTAFAKEGYEQRALDSGGACFLSKPFEATDILKCLDEALKFHPPS